MGCDQSTQHGHILTKEKARQQVAYSISQVPALKYHSANVAVLAGKGWVFNPSPPEDLSLLQRVERSMPEDMSYEAEMTKVIEAVIQSAVGMPLTYPRSEIPARRLIAKAAVDGALAALNSKLTRIQFTTETGFAQTQVTGSSYTPGLVQGSGTYQQQTVHSQDTNLYICLPEETGVVSAAPATGKFSVADELTKLKGHLDSGVLTQKEFDALKTKLLHR